MTSSIADEYLVYVGTYTQGRTEGIYCYRMDASSGTLASVSRTEAGENPSFLALDPTHRFLYAVSEVSTLTGAAGGAVNAFAVDPGRGTLSHLNRQPSGGTSPCHLSVTNNGGHVLAANYGSGSVVVFPVGQDGRLEAASDLRQHEGCSVDPKRQQGPHAHSITLDTSNRFAYAADLGLDKILIYRFDSGQGKLSAGPIPSAGVKGGAGPRHFAFHPTGSYAYLITEMGCSIVRFDYDGENGALTERQTVPTLPPDFTGGNTCADIHVHPSGRFVYGSNRGHDSIVIYSIASESGELSYVGHESTQGKKPRNFALDPEGRFLLAANMESDSIVVFRIDQETGRLSAAGCRVDVPAPVCLKLMPAG